MEYKDFFWGQQKTASKGMRLNTRFIWHYFKKYKQPKERFYHVDSLRDGEYYSICRARWQPNHVINRTIETPPRKDICDGCWRTFNKIAANRCRQEVMELL